MQTRPFDARLAGFDGDDLRAMHCELDAQLPFKGSQVEHPEPFNRAADHVDGILQQPPGTGVEPRGEGIISAAR